MNANKFLLAGIAGAVVFFLLGYLTYGMLLADFMKTHAGSAMGVGKDPKDFSFAILFLGNLLYGFLISYIFGKAGITSPGSGFAVGFIIGLLTSASYDCINYATTNLTTGANMAADIITFAVMTGISGVAVAWVRGMGKKAAA